MRGGAACHGLEADQPDSSKSAPPGRAASGEAQTKKPRTLKRWGGPGPARAARAAGVRPWVLGASLPGVRCRHYVRGAQGCAYMHPAWHQAAGPSVLIPPILASAGRQALALCADSRPGIRTEVLVRCCMCRFIDLLS